MYPYSPQLSFANGLSQSLFRTVQQYSELNIHLFQTLLEAAAKAGQPFVDALRVYQQHLSRIAVDTQIDLSKVLEQHVLIEQAAQEHTPPLQVHTAGQAGKQGGPRKEA